MSPTLLVNIAIIFVLLFAFLYVASLVYIAYVVYHTEGQRGGGDAEPYTLLDGFCLFVFAAVVANDEFRTAALWTLAILVTFGFGLVRAVRAGMVLWRKRHPTVNPLRSPGGVDNRQ